VIPFLALHIRNWICYSRLHHLRHLSLVDWYLSFSDGRKW
jgi:hypothetical protein